MDYHVGDYIYHSRFGVGRIREVIEADGSDLVIDYQQQHGLRVSVRLTENSTRAIKAEGFLALWSDDGESAIKLLEEDPARAVALALQDFTETRAQTEDLKEYFTPCFRNRDWTKWWKKTQQALKRAEYIDTSKSDEREYRLRQGVVSLAEEAFARFQRARFRANLEQAYEETKRVFNALKEGATLSDLHTDALKAFYTQVAGDASRDINTRLDALYRMEERKWLSREDAHTTIQHLVEGLKLYQLETFAQNRLLDYLLANADDSNLVPVLLTGLCANTNSLERVLDWVIKQGDPYLVVTSLRGVLSGNILPEPALGEFAALSTRLDKSVLLVQLLTASPDPLPELVSLYEKLAGRVGAARQIETEGKALIVALVRLGGVLFDRVQSCQPPIAPLLVAALITPRFSSEFILLILDARTKAQVSDAFSTQIENLALIHARSTSDPVLACLLKTEEGERVSQVVRLVERARQFGGQNEFVLEQIGTKVLALCREASDVELTQMISDLDALAHLSRASSWIHLLNNYRQRAYLVALEVLTPDISSASTGNVGVLDRALLNAIRDYMQRQLEDMRSEVAQHQKQLMERDHQATELATRLQETQSRMRELRQGYVQNPQQTRYEERFRILREFAATVAEFERFNSKPDRRSPDVDAILRRLNSLLAGQGVFPREDIGNLITFDPLYCQIVGQVTDEISSAEQVHVMERGYTIKDPQGMVRLLKPVLVQYPSTPK